MTQQITRHDTSINIRLEDHADTDKVFASVLKTLRDRGFTTNEDEEVAECIRDNYHIARKGELECYLTRSRGSIEVEFFQNVVFVNSNGGLYDFEKERKMPFLIRQQFVLERWKLEDMLRQTYGMTVTPKPSRRGMDFIANKRAELERFHGCKSSISEYNARSAINGAILSDGMPVYFLRSGRYFSGIAHHNINNMWWVLMPSGEVDNIACFDLFPQIRRNLRGRHFTQSHKDRRRMEALTKAASRGDLAKVEILRDMLTPAEAYYVISVKHTAKRDKTITMWGQSGGGYTFAFSHAGKYSKAEIMANLGYYNSGGAIAVDAETVERLASHGKDDNHHINAHLKNTPEVWSQLLRNMIAPAAYPVIPEVMEKKTRRARA